MTMERSTRLKVSAQASKRLKGALQEVFRQGRGQSVSRVIKELNQKLRGWANYFCLSEVKNIFEELDGWIRRKLRCLIWRQWKRVHTRAVKLMKRGLPETQAWQSARNGRGPWWNAGAAHMHAAFKKSYFDKAGLVSLLDMLFSIRNTSRTAVYGTVRTVV
jgi:hypothetical protein